MNKKKPDSTVRPPAKLQQLLRASGDRYMAGDHEQSLDLAETAVRLTRHLKLRHSEAMALDLRGQAFFVLGRHDEAIEDGRAALNIYKETRRDAEAATARGNVGARLMNTGRLAEAEKQNLLGLEECTHLRLPETAAHIRRNLGWTYYLLGRLPEASNHLNQAIEGFHAQGLTMSEAQALLDLTSIYQAQEDFPHAEGAARQAQTLLQGNRPAPVVARSHFVLASILSTRSEWAEAESQFHRAIADYEYLGDTRNRAVTEVSLAKNYINQELGREALDILAQTIDTYEHATPGPAPGDVADAYSAQGMAYARMAQWPEAEKSLRTAMAAIQGDGHPELDARLKHELGQILAQLKRWTEAKQLLNEARKNYQQLERHNEAADVLLGIGSYHFLRRHYWKSTAAFKKANTEFQNLKSRQGQARALTALASAQDAYGFLSTAGSTLGNAFVRFTSTGHHQEAAWAVSRQADQTLGQVNMFRWLYRMDTFRRVRLESALELAIPAAAYLDSIKFQFPKTADRIRAGTRSRSAWNVTLELATALDNAQLLTELIETIINGSSHTTPTNPSHHMHPPEHIWTRTPTLEPAMLANGTTHLLATAQLPASPGPPLLTPSTTTPRTALHSWTTNTPYPAAPRPTTPIRTW
jgi:tetratricopeptide (TPR) repeat protein